MGSLDRNVILISLGWLIPVLLLGCSSVPKVRILHDPLTPQEHLQLGLSYEAQGKLDLAVQEYEAALRKGGRKLGASPRLFLGNVYARRGELQRAQTQYEKALVIEPDQPETLNNLGWVYLQRGIHLDRAEEMVRRALAQGSVQNRQDAVWRAMVLHTLAEIQMAGDRMVDALDTLREAEGLVTPEHPGLLAEILESKARAHAALGETEQAGQALQKVRRLR